MANCSCNGRFGRYPRCYQNCVTVDTQGTYLQSLNSYILCIKGIDRIPPTFYFYHDVVTPSTVPTDTMVFVSTRSGNVPLVDNTGAAVTVGDLTIGSLYNAAKVDVCHTAEDQCNCSSCEDRVSLIQLVNFVVGTTTTQEASSSTESSTEGAEVNP